MRRDLHDICGSIVKAADFEDLEVFRVAVQLGFWIGEDIPIHPERVAGVVTELRGLVDSGLAVIDAVHFKNHAHTPE